MLQRLWKSSGTSPLGTLIFSLFLKSNYHGRNGQNAADAEQHAPLLSFQMEFAGLWRIFLRNIVGEARLVTCSRPPWSIQGPIFNPFPELCFSTKTPAQRFYLIVYLRKANFQPSVYSRRCCCWCCCCCLKPISAFCLNCFVALFSVFCASLQGRLERVRRAPGWPWCHYACERWRVDGATVASQRAGVPEVMCLFAPTEQYMQ